MVFDDKRVRIVVGHYGSGKTEFSVNYAIELSKNPNKNYKTAIADLDVINPYFRSREKEELLDKYSIESFSSILKNSTLDLPSISADLGTPIVNENYQYVMDVGGDELGARVLGSINNMFQGKEYDMFMVINAYRQYTSSPEDVVRYIRSIEAASRLEISGLVSNTHLLWDTKPEDIIKGYELVKEVSKLSNIPLKYVVYPNYIDKSSLEIIDADLFKIDMIMREDWM